ncbi:MAG: glycosyltransferase [Acidobacteria bacterium]|nr:glycosyltransferase [Acidobacteriota bacterium]
MKRLAFLSPLPPAATGIADYAAEVLGLLAGRYAIDVFHDQDDLERERLPASCGVHRCGEFLSRHRGRPYDLAVYQMGNGPAHAFLYDLLPRVPGLLILHDLVLHHSRARQFLDTPDARAYAADPSSAALRARALEPLSRYEAEVTYAYPAQARRLVETHMATVGDLLPYAYPLFRLPVEASRATAAHNVYMTEAVGAEVPGVATFHIPMMAEAVSVTPDAVAAVRARYGLAPGAFVVGSFGLLTREKRVETVARAVARASAALPAIRLLLVGPVPDRAALEARLESLGVRDRTVITGRVPFAELPAHIEAADLVVHLRYPTARETSAALLRVLAQGRPTVVSDLEHLADVPADAVLRSDVADEEGEVTRALLRLAERPETRIRLGQSAAAFVRREHSPERCRDAYVEAIEAAASLPDPPRPADWPAHWPRP